MTDLFGSAADVDRLLRDSELWFVVGLGNNPDRAAFGVASVLQQRGKRMIPIHPRAEVVHGEQGYATIAEAAAAVGIPDVVDVLFGQTGPANSPTRRSQPAPVPCGFSSMSSTKRPPSGWLMRA